MNDKPDPERDIETVKADRDQDSFLERWTCRLIMVVAALAIVWALS